MFEDDEIVAQIPHLRRFARALAGDRQEADDLVQDCLERALQKRRLFHTGTNLRAWLFTVMHRIHASHRVRAGRRAKPESLDESVHVVPVRPEQEARLAVSALQRALDLLPPEQKEVVLLVALEQMSYDEVSRVLEIPIGTVMSRLHRGRERLRALLAGGGQARRVP